MLFLYRSLIRSKLDYASLVYDSAPESIKRMLDTVHHQGVRLATGSFRTSPVSSLLVDAHEPPLRLRRQLLTMRYALRIRQFCTHPTYHSIFSQSLLEVFTGGAVRGTQPLCVRVSELMQSADINVARVAPLTSSRIEPWLLDPPTCDTDLSKHRKTFTLADLA